MIENRIYLDNCCFNRPFDAQTNLNVYLETQAKLFIQSEILNKRFELAWSYIMDYEIFSNPNHKNKNQISKWKNIAIIDVDETEIIISIANQIMKNNIKPKDSLHIACAIETGCKYFLTTDKKLLNKNINEITIINPINFIQLLY